jgi:hypothetical protein
MTTGPDPTRRESALPGGRERGFGDRRDPGEPRFAGPPTADSAAATTPAAFPVPTGPAPPAVPAVPAAGVRPPYLPPSPRPFPPPPDGDLAPVVDYGPGAALPVAETDRIAMARLGAWIAATGGVLAVVGSFFTWATLRLTANGADSQGFTADPSTVTYNGLSLLEGRVMLVLGIVAVALGGISLSGRAERLVGPALAVTGVLALVVMVFTAVGHPVELATLLRSYRQIDAVKVSLPNGAGTWLAVAGAVLMLCGGLLTLMRSAQLQREGRA